MTFKTTDELLKYQLSKFLYRLDKNKNCIRQGCNNAENLHRFRIAVRKIRAVLSQMKVCFDKTILTEAKDNFRFLGSATNEARDTDVYLIKLNDYRQLLDEGFRNGLNALKPLLEEKQRIEYEKLNKLFGSERYKSVIQGFGRNLASDTFFKNTKVDVFTVARQKISESYSNVIRFGKNINLKSSNQEFHDLRLLCKKLRYLLEIFLPVLNTADTKNVLKKLKSIQELLGDFQDYEVHQKKMNQFKNEFELDKTSDTAIDILIRGFAEEQLAVKTVFDKEFRVFMRENFEIRAKQASKN